MIVRVDVSYKNHTSSMVIDLEKHKDKEDYLFLIQNHIEITKSVIEKIKENE